MNAQWCIALSMMMLGSCHADVTRPNPQLPGSALGSSCTSATRDVQLTVTDLDTREELPGISIDRTGQVSSVLPPGHYAFAATTPTTYVFDEKASTIAGRPALTQSSDCHRLQVHVTGARVLPETIILSRLS